MDKFISIIQNVSLAVSPIITFIFFRYLFIDYNSIIWHSNGIEFLNIVIYILSTFSIFYMMGIPIYSFMKENRTINILKFNCSEIVYIFICTIIPVNILVIFGVSSIVLSIPFCSSIAIYILSLLLGFSLAIELRYENDLIDDKELLSSFQKHFDCSIGKYLPPLIIITMIIIPIEHYFITYHHSKGLLILIIIVIAILIFNLNKIIYKTLFNFLNINPNNEVYNKTLLIFLPIIGILLFQSWEYLVLNSNSINLHNKRYLLYFLFFTGLIPIRILYVIEPNASDKNKFYSFLGIILFITIKLII